MEKLIAKMQQDMVIQNYSPRTIEAYMWHVDAFTKFFPQELDTIGEDEIRKYLYHAKAEKNFSASSMSQAFSAIKFLFRETLNMPVELKTVRGPRQPKRLPEVLSQEEIKKIFDAVENTKHQLILMTTYSAGLRLNEATHLKVSDIDSNRMLIRVEQGKGKKDRYTLLSEPLLPRLRDHWRHYRPRVWLFPGRDINKPIRETSVQKVFQYERISYCSCRNRHCPKCQALAREKWLLARKQNLLPISYFHIVLTIPDSLNPLALVNQKVVYNILFKAGSETLLELGRDPKHLGAEIGIIAVLHTWGQNLMDHPHLHCITTGGGLSKDGKKWISPKKTKKGNDFFVHVDVISDLFKKKFPHYHSPP